MPGVGRLSLVMITEAEGELMGTDELNKTLTELARQQKELVEALMRKREKNKDFWDKFSSASTFISGVIVALVGLYFTNSYNAQQAARDEILKTQQLRLAEVEVVQKFIPQLNGTDKEKKLALIAISSLGNAELATKIAVLDQSEGAKAALQSLSESGSPEEKRYAQRALENFKQYESSLSNLQGGSKVGRAALDKAIQELKSGVWEESDTNKGVRMHKYLTSIGLPEKSPWSAAFVSWCFAEGQNPPPFKPSGAWFRIREEFKSKGWLHESSGYVPQPGDILFIIRENTISGHGGIVFRYENGTVETIEGNVVETIGGTAPDQQSQDVRMVRAMTRKIAPNMFFGHIPD